MPVPDYRRTLSELRNKWEGCTACELGVRRVQTKGAFVFGEGTTRAIMVIGDGPDRDDDREGSPFQGNDNVLRGVLQTLNMTDIVYCTNLVSCRSCSHAYDNEGKPKFYDNGKPMILDNTPTPPQIAACSDRLLEEVYLVDPVLIVTLGDHAASKLLGRVVKAFPECGSLHTAQVPGAGRRAVLTEKKQQWLHKVRGEWVCPTEQNTVEYPVLVNIHPSIVCKNLRDRRPGSPVEQFYATLQLARNIYRAYAQEIA